MHGIRPLAPALLTIGIGLTAFAAGLVAVWSYLHYGITFASASRVTTFSLSREWRYPHELRGPLLAWMVVSPLAFIAIVSGVARLQRLVPAPRRQRSLPWQTALLVPTWLVVGWWAIDSQDYQNPFLRAGRLDLALIITMTISLLLAAATERDFAGGS
jgi:hypothetical protein